MPWLPISDAPRDRVIQARGHDFGVETNPVHTVFCKWDDEERVWKSEDGVKSFRYLREWFDNDLYEQTYPEKTGVREAPVAINFKVMAMPTAGRPDRNKTIAKRHQKGETLQSLATEYGITKARVQQIVKDWKAKNNIA